MDIVLISILVVYTFNLLGKSAYLILVFIPFMIFTCTKIDYRKKHFFTLTILLLFLLSTVLTSLYYGYLSTISSIEILFYPILFYLIGVKLTSNDYEYKKSYIILYMIIFVTFIYMFLNYFNTISLYGSLETAKLSLGGRALIDFWDNTERPATFVIVSLSFGLAAIPTLFFNIEKLGKKLNFFIKISLLFVFFTSLYLSIQLGSRTSVIIIIVSLIVVQLALFKFTFRTLINYILIFICLGISKYLFEANVFDLKEMWINSQLYERFQSSGMGSSRFFAWKEVLIGIFNYPLGGRKSLSSLEYVHNLWLDVANDVGIFPLALIIIFTAFSITSLLKFIISKQHPVLIKALFLSIFVAFFISFMTEPILRTQERFLFVLFCLIVGLLQGLNSLNRIKLI